MAIQGEFSNFEHFVSNCLPTKIYRCTYLSHSLRIFYPRVHEVYPGSTFCFVVVVVFLVVVLVVVLGKPLIKLASISADS
jgi:hypothetical protein